MSRRVLKFPLGAHVIQIETADEPRFLAVGWQHETLVVWAEATVGKGVSSLLYPAVTGDAPPPDAEYVGTAQHPTLNRGGPLVIHVYRQVR